MQGLWRFWMLLTGVLQDCRDVEDAVERTFAGADAPPALIFYVGQKPEYVHLRI